MSSSSINRKSSIHLTSNRSQTFGILLLSVFGAVPFCSLVTTVMPLFFICAITQGSAFCVIDKTWKQHHYYSPFIESALVSSSTGIVRMLLFFILIVPGLL